MINKLDLINKNLEKEIEKKTRIINDNKVSLNKIKEENEKNLKELNEIKKK